MIPTIENRTEVLILQHARERFHPFNTARIVRKALSNSDLLVGHNEYFAETQLPFREDAGLLYPGPSCIPLNELRQEDRPSQLVIIDGTWHHAKTMVRDIPAIRELPRFCLAPTSPGRYRIRREPNDTSLSTLEASVAALKQLEPETKGLDELTRAFNVMVEQQLDHPNLKQAWRRKSKSDRTTVFNIPRMLRDLSHVVAVYGESAPGNRACARGDKPEPQPPVYWVAERLGSGEQFSCFIQHETLNEIGFLNHLQLSPAASVGAVRCQKFLTKWAEFLRPDDTLVVYDKRTIDLLNNIGANHLPFISLKSIDFRLDRKPSTLPELLDVLRVSPGKTHHEGRAGNRLANIIALVRYLNAMFVADVKTTNCEKVHR